jgi:transcriptional regulator with XRE-family HTH domain
MDEKHAFSERFLAALKSAGVAITSPTRLALQFNLLHHGKPVTAQAVRKWLAGQAIPSHDKLLTLALWLNIPPSVLRFGEDNNSRQQVDANHQSKRPELELAQDIIRLRPEHQLVVKAVVATLLRVEKSQQVD